MTQYKVIKGDTLYGISNQFGVSVEDLKRENSLSSNNISIGQTIIIPDIQGTNPENIVNYTVKRGDSLYKIARVYKTNVNTLKKLNNLTSNNLSVGQNLLIPETYFDNTNLSYPSFINYKVSRGDSLYSISKKYNISVKTIIEDNALKSNLLSIGQTLKIRQSTLAIEECFGTTRKEYVVQKGDSLYSIAKNNNTTVSKIIEDNNLKSTNLKLGQIIKL